MKLYNFLLGQDLYEPYLQNDGYSYLEYASNDTFELYNENEKHQPHDWYYRNKTINYRYNKYGHRSKNIEELDFDNYCLFIGCSQTEGIGLELENTYPYLLSKNLNCDYYNLGMSGSGMDVVLYNLITWYNQFKKPPKYTIIQFPDDTRFLSQREGYKNYITNGTWDKEEEVSKFIAAVDLSGYNNMRRELCYKLIENTAKNLIPIRDKNIFRYGHSKYALTIRKKDKARDLVHSGIESQKLLVDEILVYIKEIYKD